MSRYRRIVVPLDGSDLAASALEQARELAELHAAPLFLVRVVDPPLINTVSVVGMRPTHGVSDATYLGEDKAAHEYIDRHVDHLRSQGVQASGVVVWGDAARGVVSTLNDTDLLVMTSQGRSGVRRWFLGSVAEDILKLSSVPVLIIRQAGESAG